MFRTIVVPLDGSSASEAVLPTVARLARSEDATLVLVRVVNFAEEYGSLLPRPSLIRLVIEIDLEEANVYLQQLAISSELAGLRVRVVARLGIPAATILDVAESCKADLIVLARSQSPSGVPWMRGGIVKKVARHSSIPVLVFPAEGAAKTAYVSQIAHPLRILVPLDGSANARAALEPAAELLTALARPGQKKALHLVRVIAFDPHNRKLAEDSLHWRNEIERARYHLSQKAEWLKKGYLVPLLSKQHIPVTWSIAVDKDVASALLRIAEHGDDTEGAGVFGGCDLLAMSTHGRTGMQRWMMGSVAERVLAATRHPLLIVHPPESAVQSEPELAEVVSM